MFDFQAYVNARAIIHDTKTKQTVADTPIVETHPAAYSISIARSAFVGTPPTQVSLLISVNNTLYEYQGSIRRDSIGSRTVDIALFKGKQKESRAAVRYAVNMPVRLENQILANARRPLSEAVDALLLNISRQGCLLRANSGLVPLGAVLEFHANQGESTLLLRARVLRVTPVNDEMSEYGCRLVEI